jgi:hypothetical protein
VTQVSDKPMQTGRAGQRKAIKVAPYTPDMFEGVISLYAEVLVAGAEPVPGADFPVGAARGQRNRRVRGDHAVALSGQRQTDRGSHPV